MKRFTYKKVNETVYYHTYKKTLFKSNTQGRCYTCYFNCSGNCPLDGSSCLCYETLTGFSKIKGIWFEDEVLIQEGFDQ